MVFKQQNLKKLMELDIPPSFMGNSIKRISILFFEPFPKVSYGFVKIYMWISFSCYMDLSKLLHGIVKVFLCISRSSPNKTKLKFDQDF